ncbi:MAG TPA: 4Fe-4S dicluster domain-containing protein [Planctomycetota bacterium]|nr:4Fe-4S dicluster domain-containing protein [Planctomycetota bacterium]
MPSSPGVLRRVVHAILPAALFSDHEKGRPGLVRRFLKWIGPVTYSAPFRRVLQALCFVLFFYFFFYVCWPYTAEPAPYTTLAEAVLPAEARLMSSAELATALQDSSRRAALEMAVATEVENRAGAGLILSSCEGHPEWIGQDVREIAAAQQRSAASLTLELCALPEPPKLWRSHYDDDRRRKERVHAELFLIIDPLVAISTSIAGRTWEWSLVWALGILLVCVLIPRGFCGYLCPLGTLIDCFDWAIGKRVKRFRVERDGPWMNIKYYLLAGVLIASLFGVLLTGFVAAIPVITRGMLFFFDPIQTGVKLGWHQVPPLNAGHIVSMVLFVGVLALGLMRKRFWCRYVCPSGAVFSVFNLFRVSERKVESSCINCNKCVEICPFDAIKPDYTTRTPECTLCQTCGGVCPTHSIKFVERWNLTDLKKVEEEPKTEQHLARRGFLIGGAASLLTVLGMRKAFGAGLGDAGTKVPLRPPGSVPEEQFLQMCIRCGECFKACPNHVLQPVGFGQGLEGLWTPEVVANWAGCESSCNNCGQVCPTAAIRALPLEEKRVARMGLAELNLNTCLPYAGKEACQLCVDECTAAGYNALEFQRVHVETDEQGMPIEGTGYLAPVLVPANCVGCGLCQARCNIVNVKEKKTLAEPAIVIHAGAGSRPDGSHIEDRLMDGSYRSLRDKENAKRAEEQKRLEQELQRGQSGEYLPDFLK